MWIQLPQEAPLGENPMKFRVWCHDKREWEKDDIIIDLRGNLHHNSPMLLRANSHTLQLCTGLQDSHGQYIYEGDIVDQGDNFNSIVKFGECYETGTVGFYLEEVKTVKGEKCPRTHSLLIYTIKPIAWKIVGNIFCGAVSDTPKPKKQKNKHNRFEMIEFIKE